MLIIVEIALDSDTKHEFTSLYKYSPLQNLIRELERDLQRPAKPADLLGIYVEFTVKYNGGYCNLKAIRRMVA